MIDQESADMLANSVWSEDIVNLSAEELDKLAIFQWADDPDIEFEEFAEGEDAGIDGHGVHTEEEMMYREDGLHEEDLD